MLKYNTISYKPKTKINNEECIDLLAKTANVDKLEIHPISMCIVNEYYVARPDLISLAFYGSDEYGDVICKVNGISNPFELNDGMILEIPSLEDIHTLYEKRERSSSELIETNSTISKKTNIYQKLFTETRSPAQQTVGYKSFIVNKDLGLVFY